MANGIRVEFTIEIVVERDTVGYHAYCPAFKGLHVFGETEDEAIRNAQEAAIAYLESLIKHGEPIPIGMAHCSSPIQLFADVVQSCGPHVPLSPALHRQIRQIAVVAG